MSTSGPLRLESANRLSIKALELTRHEPQGPTQTTQVATSMSGKLKPPPTKSIFALFLFANLLINYDGGVIPASLVQIEQELHISYTQEAALGNVY